ncbi:phage portal protein [Aneurinibacillus thermoaerophilus]|uniref:phage portal protein n=1 Tax=Aneurinibacillus thermoaerophilus TaxID=143495 RepID=UPI002E1D0A64|nr:phage portal protein [Aneurinibacillus thermoaerophilus]MED0765979.1 phage portal protein [Aneurinibacillus thermoaerophilus]
MSLAEYIKDKHNNKQTWFVDECSSFTAQSRVMDILNKKEYLSGQHKILQRSNEQFNGKEFVSRKIVLNYAKTMINFQSMYLLKNNVTLSGNEAVVKEYKRIYKKGKFHRQNENICDSVIKYGNCYEYLYFDGGVIKSKIIKPEDGYPVFSDENQYICFVEHYTVDSVSYYYVYTPDTVEKWTDRGGELKLVGSYRNLSGLPIRYKSQNELDDQYGRSDLDDYINILDNMEDLISKSVDAFYKYITGMPVLKGQTLKGESLPVHTVGGGIVIDTDADFKFEQNQFDYQAFEALYKTLMQALLDVSCTPAVSMNKTDVSNLSEVSIRLLYSLAEIKAAMNERYMRDGIEERHEQIRKMLEYQGITFDDEDFDTLDVVFVFNTPQNAKEIIENLQMLDSMGAISLQSILEQNPYIHDVVQEMDRIRSDTRKQNVDNDTNDNTIYSDSES